MKRLLQNPTDCLSSIAGPGEEREITLKQRGKTFLKGNQNRGNLFIEKILLKPDQSSFGEVDPSSHLKSGSIFVRIDFKKKPKILNQETISFSKRIGPISVLLDEGNSIKRCQPQFDPAIASALESFCQNMGGEWKDGNCTPKGEEIELQFSKHYGTSDYAITIEKGYDACYLSHTHSVLSGRSKQQTISCKLEPTENIHKEWRLVPYKKIANYQFCAARCIRICSESRKRDASWQFTHFKGQRPGSYNAHCQCDKGSEKNWKVPVHQCVGASCGGNENCPGTQPHPAKERCEQHELCPICTEDQQLCEPSGVNPNFNCVPKDALCPGEQQEDDDNRD